MSMPWQDLFFVLQWWAMFVVLGVCFLPITTLLFPRFIDKGYPFAKVFAVVTVSYTVFLLGVTRFLPFTTVTVYATLLVFLALNCYLAVAKRIRFNKQTLFYIFFEELLFLATLIFWSYVRGHQPDIHGLEKFMDFGFVNAILRSDFFPPKDMWFTPLSINYYYFGHLETAVLTRLSTITPAVTYNLMIATLFSFAATTAFSIGVNLISGSGRNLRVTQTVAAGLLSGFLLSSAGNLHTLYSFFTAYVNENPVPFTQLIFSPQNFPNSYWYPNATRFIQHTIHEFPIYSFVVSDLHGHVLDIPLVIAIIAILLHCWMEQKTISFLKAFLLSFLLAVAYMTNAWDGAIYLLLTLTVALLLNWRVRASKKTGSISASILKEYVERFVKRHYLQKLEKKLENRLLDIFTTTGIIAIVLVAGFVYFSLPFSLFFKPFVSGIGVLCAPSFLVSLGHLGPFLFEPNHCQRSHPYQLFILYGFFYFWSILLVLRSFKEKKENFHLPFLLCLIALASILLLLPELIYMKDIYPADYRANTMFKLGYEAFMMFSLVSAYSIVDFLRNLRTKFSITKGTSLFWLPVATAGAVTILLVSIYPYFAITSYYGELRTYQGLNGLTYLKTLYPNDYDAISWINVNIQNQPVILEAQGDSYTDYARVSANTGLPTVLGWTVHEWLWRGTYDIPAPRINEVKTLYETNDILLTKQLLNKYKVKYVFVGDLERQKYPGLNQEKFQAMGRLIYQKGNTTIFAIGK